MNTMVAAVPGLHYVADYVMPAEHTALLAAIDAQPWLHTLKRRVQHYGYRYDYMRRTIDDSSYLGALPAWSQSLTERLVRDGWSAQPVDQLIVNDYQPG